MTCLSSDAINNFKQFAYAVAENCVGQAIGGAVLASAATVLKISIFAANPIGAAALCATVGLAECLHTNACQFLKVDTNKNTETNIQLNRLIGRICFGVKMAIWLTAASFAATHLGVPLIAGTFLVIGAGVTLEAVLYAKNWITAPKPPTYYQNPYATNKSSNKEDNSRLESSSLLSRVNQ